MAMWLCGYVAIIFNLRESPPSLNIFTPTPAPARLLGQIFHPQVLSITHAREVSLTNNQEKSEILAKRQSNLQWKIRFVFMEAQPPIIVFIPSYRFFSH